MLHNFDITLRLKSNKLLTTLIAFRIIKNHHLVGFRSENYKLDACSLEIFFDTNTLKKVQTVRCNDQLCLSRCPFSINKYILYHQHELPIFKLACNVFNYFLVLILFVIHVIFSSIYT